jgi:glycosyltransferase involved in cell wall biosynthesis/2-polyprenyl-3-methyl-5-hydroxy-6-metoxy-1,4-benzoquinol methylase
MSSPESSLASSIGVDVAGYLRGGLGLGQAARLYVAALQAGGVPVRTTTVDLRMPEVHADDGTRAEVKTTDFADLDFEGELPFNLVCVNAPELPQFVSEAGRDRFRDRYTIGVWAWETDAIPASWDTAFGLVDEIWVYSRYVADLLSHSAPCPVVRVPLPIEVPRPSGDDVGFAFGADQFTFLFLFDFWSTLQRKNPIGLVRAFTRAFEPGEGPRLLLKSFNGDYKPDRLAQLRAATAGRDDIVVVDRFVTDQQRINLINRCDAYVSLHRSEGFGLTLGEAMALGKPVIGTGFGGNTDFMTHANAWLVDYEETQVGPEGENYPAHGTWAEPDVDHAAELMRRVWEEREEAAARAERGRMDVAEHFSLEAVGAMARARLRRLSGLSRRRAVVADASAPSPGLPHSYVETAAVKATFDPLKDAVEAGGAKGAARRALLTAMRPYTYHQDELNRFVVNALRELDALQRDQIVDTQAELRRLGAQVERFERVFGRSGLANASGDDVARLLEGVRARPASTHPAISYVDESGRRALGFRDAHLDATGYRGFEDIFRGDEQDVRQAQERYVEMLRDSAWVLDLGCGRGELLDALRDAGIRAKGVDLDEGMVARCREKGHEVELADAATALRSYEDGTVPAVFAAQVVEHLSAEQLSELLSLCVAKLAPGGVAIFETVNPHNPAALKAFWTDTTHHHPVFPEVLLAHCRLAGFASGDVRFPNESGDFDTDVYANRDYAVVARVAPGS